MDGVLNDSYNLLNEISFTNRVNYLFHEADYRQVLKIHKKTVETVITTIKILTIMGIIDDNDDNGNGLLC